MDYSWFVVLFLIIFWLSSFYRDALGVAQGSTEPYLLAVASALLFFGSILLHELGHAFVARRHGIGVSGITLWMFGGFARLEKDSDSPATEFKIAIAGPLVTLVIALACVGAFLLLAPPGELLHGALTQSGTKASGPGDSFRLARGHQPVRTGLQPGSGLPARRRPHRAFDRLVADRQSKQRHQVRRHPRRVVRPLPDPGRPRLLHRLSRRLPRAGSGSPSSDSSSAAPPRRQSPRPRSPAGSRGSPSRT